MSPKATLYRHFASKDELVLAFLARREQLWTKDWVEAGAAKEGRTPRIACSRSSMSSTGGSEVRRSRGCSFINILLEMTPRHELGKASIEYLANIRSVVRMLAEEACLTDPESFARSWPILMKGRSSRRQKATSRLLNARRLFGRLLITAHR